MPLPRSHRSAFQSVKNKENRDLVSQNPQNFLACGAASRSLRLTITRAGVLAVVHLVATPFRITTRRALTLPMRAYDLRNRGGDSKVENSRVANVAGVSRGHTVVCAADASACWCEWCAVVTGVHVV